MRSTRVRPFSFSPFPLIPTPLPLIPALILSLSKEGGAPVPRIPPPSRTCGPSHLPRFAGEDWPHARSVPPFTGGPASGAAAGRGGQLRGQTTIYPTPLASPYILLIAVLEGAGPDRPIRGGVAVWGAGAFA